MPKSLSKLGLSANHEMLQNTIQVSFPFTVNERMTYLANFEHPTTFNRYLFCIFAFSDFLNHLLYLPYVQNMLLTVTNNAD